MAFVRLLKDNNGQQAGTKGEVSEGRADYLVREGIAEYVESEKPEVKKQTKKVEPCKTC